MAKENSINGILTALGFDEREKKAFRECITLVKLEQTDDTVDAQGRIKAIIQEAVNSEIPQDNIS